MRIASAIVALCAAGLLIVNYRHWLIGDPRRASQRTVGIAILILMASTMVALAHGRAAKHWGGADLRVPCETVRAYRAEINAMSAEARADWAQRFGITRKQRRQAAACLREVN